MRPLVTQRLILREWKPADAAPFARINADPRVMEWFPSALTVDESNQMLSRIEAHFRERGFGPFAAEIRDNGQLAGFIGLMVPTFNAAFTPCVEIGWRLAAEYWGAGIATEGAREVVRHAFEDLNLPSLVSFTTAANVRSRRVMQKLGMIHDSIDDFEHPALPEGHPLRPHVLYRLSAK